MVHIKFIKEYDEAGAEKRFYIMMDNFDDFLNELDKAEKMIFYQIKAESERKRRRETEELGTRVKTSGIGDPTANEAISNVILEEVFKTGIIDDSLVKNNSGVSEYKEEIRTMRIMRLDYDLLKYLVEHLSERDARLIKKRFVDKMLYKEIGFEEGKKGDTVRKEIGKICEELKEDIIECLKMNCR